MFVTSLLLTGAAVSIVASLEFIRPVRSADPFSG